MNIRKIGFTIVELIVIISVIALLTAVATFAFTRNLDKAADSQRTVNAESIAEALEKYYEENGEYPGCEAITSPASVIQSNTLKGIDPAVLLTPSDEDTSATNSIRCTAIEDTEDDIFSYIGDDSSVCQTGPACASFTLSYREASTGEIISIHSRHTAELIVTTLTLNAESTGTNTATASWNGLYNSVDFQLQISTTAGFAAPTTTTYTEKSVNITGLIPDTTYFLRVRASLTDGGYSPWSSVAEIATEGIGAPTGTITIAGSVSGTTISATSSGGTCPAGATIERQIRVNANNTGYQAWVNGASRTIAGQQGGTYTLQGQARCINSGVAGSWKTSGTTIAVIGVTAPTGLTMTAAMSGATAIGTAGGGTCAAGTTKEVQMRYNSSPTTTPGTWSAWTTGTTRSVGALQGHKYIFSQQARCVGVAASSAWALSGEANTVYAIAKPAVPAVTATQSSKTFAWTAVACPSGTTRGFQYQFTSNVASAGSWIATTATSVVNSGASSQGVTYGANVQARCYTAHYDSGWTGTGAKSFIVPMAAHPQVAQWASKHVAYGANARANVRLKTYSRACASGQVRGALIQTSWETGSGANNWVNATSWVVATDGLQLALVDSVTGGVLRPGEMLEIIAYARCRNDATGYMTDTTGAVQKLQMYDIGNLYVTKDGTKYKIGCTPVGSMPSYCAGGYSSGGDAGNSTYRSCAVRTGGIADTESRYTALIALGSNPPCW